MNYRSTRVLKALIFLLLISFLFKCSNKKEHRRPNVIFIAIDDLRPELGCYGNEEIITPNFDRLASEGMLFTKAYCQVAVCAPSRASIMTGLRPDSSRVWVLGDSFRKNMPDVVTIPQHFKKFGYHTVSIGKIFHNHMPDSVSFDEPDLRPAEYSTPDMVDRDAESFYYDDEIKKEHALVREERIKKNPNRARYGGGWAYGRSVEIADAKDDELYDGAQTVLAIEKLKELKDKDEPFFLALGYYRPHLPFVAPKKYWDLYDPEKLSMPSNNYQPKDAPVMAINTPYELTGCYDLEYVKHPTISSLSPDSARLLRHGYYASVSYVDALLGKLMDAIKEMKLDDNTIIVVWGDHGWKLGEHNGWSKMTNYEIDIRVPLIVKAPGISPKGKSNGLVELVDVYSTLCDLAGIDIPTYLQGTSFKPLLENPDREWKSAAFSQFQRRPRESIDGQNYMGYSMITDRYHYVEWYGWDQTNKEVLDFAATELYDLQNDPEENTNMANQIDKKELLDQLSKQLKRGWKNAQPNI
ncbi:MAG: sulfatase, partial [Flammeovirgaceae bacterium]|nr:sulfatase [Flammeovirgaceae bacterium]